MTVEDVIKKNAQCRFCGIHARFDILEIKTGFRAKCRACGATGPTMKSYLRAIECWQEMMQPQIIATLESTDTDYRDRVDRMAAAIASGVYVNSETVNIPSDSSIELRIAEWAIEQVDAIDKALAEREARDV